MTELFTIDQIFIRKLTDIVLANLSNEKFGVKELVKESGMSLYTLSRKLHTINKKTINQFIREVRLKTAKKMLQNETFSVSEVAYKVGFGSPAYFNTCFREFFGYPSGKVRENGLESTEETIINPVIEIHEEKKPLRRTLIINLSAIVFLSILIFTIVYILYPKIFKRDPLENLRSSGNKISIVVMPFQNLTNDTACYYLREMIQMNLISALSCSDELRVRQKETITEFLKTKGQTQDAAFSLSLASAISKNLNADIFIYGYIQKSGSNIRLIAQVIITNTNDVLKSIEQDGFYKADNIIYIIDSLRIKVTDFLLISKILKENPLLARYPVISSSPDAYRYFIYGAS